MSHRLLGFVFAALFTTFGSATANDPLTADTLARSLLDGEGLYTVTKGLKPVSDGFWRTRFPAAQETSPELDRARQLLDTLPLGPSLEAGVYVFSAIHDGKKNASAFIVHKPSLRSLVLRRPDVFASLGITVDTPSQQVMEKIDRGPRAMRWRAFGLVFGYPDYAVEFFVDAGEREAATKTFVERDFIQLPTFASKEARFVYAVPKGHIERDQDRQLKAATVEIFNRYSSWRSVYMDNGDLGAVALLKYWILNTRSDSLPSPCSFSPYICLCQTFATSYGQKITVREFLCKEKGNVRFSHDIRSRLFHRFRIFSD